MNASAVPRNAVLSGRKPLPAWLRMTLLGGTILGGTLGVAWLFAGGSGKPPPDKTVHSDWAAGAPVKLSEPVDPPAQPDTPLAKPNPTTFGPPAPGDLPGPAATPAPAPGIRVMQVWGDSSGGAFSPPRVAPAPATVQPGGSPPPYNAAYPAAQPPAEGNSAAGGDYASRLNPTETQPTEAFADQDDSLLLPEGSSFGCLPKSPIDTQLPGGFVCIVDENVYSADGSTILIDRYAVVTGEIQRGLELGQDRAFILWRSVRSRRVKAVLNSPATDALGQMGAPGEVVTHLWEKIKGAALLTGIESAGSAASAIASKGNGNSYVNFSQGQSLASQELQHNINIPNTLWRGQAWPLRVYVQRDVQFRRAYNNVLVAGQQ